MPLPLLHRRAATLTKSQPVRNSWKPADPKPQLQAWNSFRRDIHPGILTLNRVVFIFVFAVAAMIIRQESFAVSGKAIMNMAIGSLLGPFMTGFAQYSALKYIEASRTMIIQSTRSLFVLVGSMIYLSLLPDLLQLSGGLITIIGVIVMTWGKMKYKKRQAPDTVPASTN